MINFYVVHCIYCQVKWVPKIAKGWLNFWKPPKSLRHFGILSSVEAYFLLNFKYSDLLDLILVKMVTEGNNITPEQLNLFICYIPVPCLFFFLFMVSSKPPGGRSTVSWLEKAFVAVYFSLLFLSVPNVRLCCITLGLMTWWKIFHCQNTLGEAASSTLPLDFLTILYDQIWAQRCTMHTVRNFSL